MPITATVNPALRSRSIKQLLRIERKGAEAAARAADKAFREAEREMFASQGASGAEGPWAILSPEYAARKAAYFRGKRADYRARKRDMAMLPARYRAKVAKGYGSNKILQLTGGMMRRFTQAGDPGHVAEAVQNGDQWSVRFGARSDVASYHESGGPRLPRRNPVALSEEAKAKIVAAIAEALAPFAQRAALAIARAWDGKPRHGERAV